jgi:hypothetical protein
LVGNDAATYQSAATYGLEVRGEEHGMNSTEPHIITATIVSPEIITADRVDLPESDAPAMPITATALNALLDSTKSTTPTRTWGAFLSALAWGVLRIPFRLFQFASLLLLLAICSTLPVLQLASLGYMLEAGRRIAKNGNLLCGLPGLAKAGHIGTFLLGASLTFLPVWLVRDFAITGQLIDPSNNSVQILEIVSWVMFAMWVSHLMWSVARGARWWHYLWPQPIRILREAWRPIFWNQAMDRLWNGSSALNLPNLWWLGFRAFIGGLCWLAIPATFMAIGLRGEDRTPLQALIGFVGAILMMLITMYLPFLQMNLAVENRFRAVFELRKVRRQYSSAPWSFLLANFLTLALALPLYLLRIEATPGEYVWLLCLFFVLFSLPGRWFSGFAIYRSQRTGKKHGWYSRFPAYLVQWAYVPIYLGFLYLSLLVVWDGIASVFFQHAFLIPLPFQGT